MTSTISPVRSANHSADINHAEHDLAKSATVDDGVYALFKLIQSDDGDGLEKAKKLLENDDLVEAVKGLSTSIVGEAAAHGNVGVLSAVLEKMPVEIETPDENGMTAILRASKAGQTGAVELLIAGNAELSKTDNQGNTSLMWAALSGFLDIVKMLLVSWPATGSDEPKGIDAKNKDGQNSVMLAAEGGHTDTVNLLIENKADLNARDDRGRSVLHYAGAGGHTDTVKLVIENKADINARDGKDRTPVHYAIAGGHRDVVKLLIENKADLYAKDNKGHSPLYYAIVGGHTDIVEDLVKAGVSLQHFDAKTHTDLMLHDKANYKMLLEMLDPGARRSVKNNLQPDETAMVR